MPKKSNTWTQHDKQRFVNSVFNKVQNVFHKYLCNWNSLSCVIFHIKDFLNVGSEIIGWRESQSLAELSYSVLKHATHPHRCRSDTHDSMHDYDFALFRVVCHDLDNCVSTLISHQSLWLKSWKLLSVIWTLHSALLLWLGSGGTSWRGDPV